MPKATRDADQRLDEILQAITRIRRHIAGCAQSDFLAGGLVFDAVAMNIIVIGEAVTHLPADLKSIEAQMPWRQIVASRNLVAHGYPELDPDVIWTIVTAQLDDLEAATNRMRISLVERRGPG